MNKKELKQAFEKEFNKISVSEELKNKTLNSVANQPTKKTSHIPYLKNFAAIFIVSLLCLSIYFTNNNQISFDTTKKDTENIENYSLQKSASPQNAYGTLRKNYSTYNNSNDSIAFDMKEASVVEDLAETKSVAITEDDFLKQHPEAEKIENGYVVYEGNKETLYFFKDKILENIIIID